MDFLAHLLYGFSYLTEEQSAIELDSAFITITILDIIHRPIFLL
jgi:hypothetical protein